MTISELIEMNNEQLKEHKYWLNYSRKTQKNGNSDYLTAIQDEKKCVEYLKKVNQMINILDTLLQCTQS